MRIGIFTHARDCAAERSQVPKGVHSGLHLASYNPRASWKAQNTVQCNDGMISTFSADQTSMTLSHETRGKAQPF